MTTLVKALDEALLKTTQRETAQAARVGLRWPDLVGGQLAEHAWPQKLAQGILHIAVDHGSWAQEMLLLKPQLLAKIHREFPKPRVRDLRFHVDHLPNRQPRAIETHPQQHVLEPLNWETVRSQDEKIWSELCARLRTLTQAHRKG